MKVIGLIVDFLKIVKLRHLSTEFYGVWQLFALHNRTQYLNAKLDITLVLLLVVL